MWSNKEAKFVKLWQERECLYNISSKDYHDRSKKESAWREISEELQLPSQYLLVYKTNHPISQVSSNLITHLNVLHIINV